MKPLRAWGVGRGAWGIVVVTVGLSACRDQALSSPFQESRSSVAELDKSLADALPSVVRPEEQPFADLALRVPSSAGFFVDSLGTPVLMVRDDRDRETAIAAFEEVRRRSGVLTRLRSARHERADYSFGQLARWRDLIFEEIFNKLEAVSTLDLDERRNRIAIGIRPRASTAAREEIEGKLKTLGIERGAVVFTSQDLGRYMSGRPTLAPANQLPNALTDYFVELVGGIQVSSSLASNGVPNAPCSIGFTAWYTPASGLPQPAFVTATHCTSVWGAPDGTTFTQPAAPTPVVATESVDPHKSGCWWNWCRDSDAALAQINIGTRDFQVGLIARTTFASFGANVNGSLVIDQGSPYFIITQTASVPVGTLYHKMGRTTGWTSGYKFFSCVDHKFDHPNRTGLFDYYITKCADEGAVWTDFGDSGGSVFVRLDSNHVALIGTTVGRRGESGTGMHIFSPYSRIAGDMGGSLNVTRAATLVHPTVTASVSAGHARVDWSSVPGATEYGIDIIDFVQECGDFGFGWECFVIGYPSSTAVTTTFFQDPRATFTHVLEPWESGLVRTHITVTARDPLGARFSPPSATSRFARVD